MCWEAGKADLPDNWEKAPLFKAAVCAYVRVLVSAALGVQQPSLLGASPTIYTQQTALAAAGLTTQTPTNYQLTQTAALQQQAAAAAAALQQVTKRSVCSCL